MIVSRPSAKVALSPQQTLIAFLLFLMIVLNYLDRQILSVLAPVMRKEIGLTQTDYALAVNSFLLAYAFMYAGSGLILDRVGSRKGLAIFVALWSVASGLHAAIRGLPDWLAFGFFLVLQSRADGLAPQKQSPNDLHRYREALLRGSSLRAPASEP
jgi:MFS family permease